MQKKYEPISLDKIKTCKLRQRRSKVSIEKTGKPFNGGSFGKFLGSLPDILAAKDFREIVQAIIKARDKNRPVILGMGAHPIKAGLSPIIIHLMKKNIITAVAMNGACIVHDFELSLIGQTSEDVDSELCDGAFGMAKETGRELNAAINRGVEEGHGIGRAVGEHILHSKATYRELSILAAAAKLDIPATVHVAVGTDIIHMHPEADGASIGEGSMKDFRLFASVVADLQGGVYINLGSAVIMPEVFLKAIAVTRNLGHDVKNFTTVNMDFIQHYRARENVLRRPVLSGGRSYAITGHHEIMFPLLAAAVMEGI
ncbi:MAG: deoxyhypusine synthase family protein [Nitrospirae bacterium]|nr:deoxyhypusine synthase family protein [Nitrospirota bacterium]